ncbi:Retrovirus-related Pol poly from transposon TNT 1-94 [Labeo rohita]|uniref:Retrovirus-related Pol poly from transposon TNT 1-94 n=1 Tax=Labeo rohita TaxID=84645 RepID=A0A498NX20_LABRO|nr:Retrovirus-related Pol poly from transposon TNT 1-94 [Labeo rohita]
MTLTDNKTKECKLKDVLYIPQLSYNLLSVSKATQLGKKVRFTEDSCYITDVNQKLIATATKEGSLYYVNCRESDQVHVTENVNVHKETKEQIWHRRYGHLGIHNLKKLRSECLVDGFDFDVSKDIDFCDSCAEGKHHRSKFTTNDCKRDVEPLGLVHSDDCGKINAKSLSGAQYFLTFIDEHTHYVWVYVLKQKGEVFQKFLEWKAMAEKSTGRQLKVLRTDNGGEYTSSEFQDFLKKEGIRHELTVPKTPEQNGVAERMNKTLMETVRSMLADAKLPQKFWAEALSTAVYLRNRSPTKSVKGMTPFEAWTGEKPTVDHLRIFGCTVYAHVPKDERKKLDPKAKKCILLGYGTETKGYRLYDSKLAKVFFSRDVIFNESDHAFKKEPVANEDGAVNRYVELDCQEPDNEESPEQKVQRSARLRKPPDYYGEWVTIASNPTTEPKTVKDVLSSPDKANWKEAMEKEMESLYAISVWNRVELPKGRKAVGSKWVFKVKVDADGTFERHKARLVTQGFSQKFGSDYDETFSPVVRFEIWMGQATYSENVLKKFGMENSKPVSTPVDINTKLVKHSDDSEVMNPKQFQSAVGSLLYLSTRTRPDIAYAVNNVTRFCAKPTKQHWTAVKRIMRYLKGTLNLGLLYSKDKPKECIGFSDADWAGDQDNRKSMSGYMFQSVEQL